MDASCRRKNNNGKRTGNEHNRFAVVVLKDKTLYTVGHLQREISMNALLQDSFYKFFLIMRHISNVASQFMLSEFLFLRYITQIIIY